MSGLEALVIAGLATQAVSGFTQARAETRAATQSAQFAQALAERNAAAAEQQAAAEEMRLRRDRARRLGLTRAGFGAAGVQLAGTPLDVLADEAAEAEEEALLVRFRGRVGAQEARLRGGMEARSQTIAAQAARARGTESLLAGATDIATFGVERGLLE